MQEISVSKEICGKTVTLRTGLMAKQANGAVRTTIGSTEVLGVATMGAESIEKDFFPLSVHYTEKFYAAGRMPGGYFKREGKPTDSEVLVCRMIDRPLRPLFPDGFRTEVQIIPMVVSMDLVNPADVAGMNAASAALTISDIPFAGPVGSVRACRKENKIIINPTYEEMKDADMDIIISGTSKAITMIEGDAKEISEEDMLEVIAKGHEAIKDLVALQDELREKCGKEKVTVKVFEFDQDLTKKLTDDYYDKMVTALKTGEKKEREVAVAKIYQEANEQYASEIDDNLVKQIPAIIHDEIEKKIVRGFILNEGTRMDGRSSTDIRPIDCKVDVLENVHGSALFTRGQTQALSVSTLGSDSDKVKIDEVAAEKIKKFYLHYNFPPFSVGECGRIGATGRREIGHGMLGEKSISMIFPEDCPYVVRTVSEILESNGSSSMATICASSMSLMAAGVNIKAPVAGIAMGLIKENDQYKILTDIQGMEDHLGDMDFKVAGTKDGITGFQLDIKIEGITPEIMKEALAQAKEARLFILNKMDEAIKEPRTEQNPNAPQIKTITIPEERIRVLIGPGGKNIKSIVEQTGSQIDIEDNGTVHVFSKNQEASAKTILIIESFIGMPRVDKIYDGTVKKVVAFGAFIEIMPNTDGLCHISELSDKRVENVTSILNEGDKVKVRVKSVDGSGKISLTLKGVDQD